MVNIKAMNELLSEMVMSEVNATFSPATNLDDAFIVIEKMEKLGYTPFITRTDELGLGMKMVDEPQWQVSFMNEMRKSTTVYDSNLKKAICLSAIRTIGEEFGVWKENA